MVINFFHTRRFLVLNLITFAKLCLYPNVNNHFIVLDYLLDIGFYFTYYCYGLFPDSPIYLGLSLCTPMNWNPFLVFCIKLVSTKKLFLSSFYLKPITSTLHSFLNFFYQQFVFCKLATICIMNI